ncbi:MAG TPA: S9 family peptidase [Thermoanaerobaculia bacterium]|nr:S9 family peptidase [Thermoanaerobaculia bacterium]
MRRALFTLLLLAALPLSAQKKQVTLEAIYEPTTKVAFSGAIQSGFDWLDDNTFVWPKKDATGKLVSWQLYDATTGKARSFFDRDKVQQALVSAGLSADVAKEAASAKSLTFDAKKSAAVMSIAGDLFLYNFAKNSVTRLTTGSGEEEEATFSPDGQKIAFIRHHDLFVTDLAGRERQITTTGSDDILNGILDWVYQEEIYGRYMFKAYWWSPDSSRLAFLQLDEKPVHRFTVVDHIPYRQDLEVYPYPKAGDPNPIAHLFVAPVAGGDIVPVDNDRYSGAEHLIVNVAWNGDGSAVVYQVQNREQTWLDLDFADPSDGKSRTILRDTTKAWVDPIDAPKFLADGSFLWQSERSGWRHVYHYRADGTLIRQVTNGEWEVRDLHGVDEKSGYLYFSGSERSVLGNDIYRIKLDGSGLQRLSAEAGTHGATFNPSLTRYVDKWSDILTPDQVRLYDSAGKLTSVVDENAVTALAEYDLPKPEFMQVKTRDGFVMEAIMIKPSNFDPAKKYPVFQFLYAGPHAQTVRNTWRGQTNLFYRYLATQGMIVWMCDNRTASGKGAVSSWGSYKQFGVSELRDIEDGIAWLKTQPYVDGSRVMLSGWSFGGFMTSYALTHSTTFKAGIAGGTVADWRDYDSIYTERLMLMPQNNPEGYRNSSPRWAAKDLHGDLLLLHGTIDDNVHMQNTIQFAYELEKAGKKFEMMLYPKSRHGVTDPALVYHLQRVMTDFARRELLAP